MDLFLIEAARSAAEDLKDTEGETRTGEPGGHPCPTCGGSGQAQGGVCPACNGTGQLASTGEADNPAAPGDYGYMTPDEVTMETTAPFSGESYENPGNANGPYPRKASSNPAFPNGQCPACGTGLDERGYCQDEDCSNYGRNAENDHPFADEQHFTNDEKHFSAVKTSGFRQAMYPGMMPEILLPESKAPETKYVTCKNCGKKTPKAMADVMGGDPEVCTDCMRKGFTGSIKEWSDKTAWFDGDHPIETIQSRILEARALLKQAQDLNEGDIADDLSEHIETLEATATEYDNSWQAEYLANLPGGTVAMEYGNLIEGGLVDLGEDDGSWLYSEANKVQKEANSFDWDAFPTLGAEAWVLTKAADSPGMLQHSDIMRMAAVDYARDKTMTFLDPVKRATLIDQFVTNVEKLRRRGFEDWKSQTREAKVASVNKEARDTEALNQMFEDDGILW